MSISERAGLAAPSEAEIAKVKQTNGKGDFVNILTSFDRRLLAERAMGHSQFSASDL